MAQNRLADVMKNRGNFTVSLPVTLAALSTHAQNLHSQVKQFIDTHIVPFEPEFLKWSNDQKTKWTIHPHMERLKAKAKSEGLWNLFLTKDYDPSCQYGAGLTNVEYAFIAQEMGRSLIASEVFNCSAPDTGNMEVLVRYGSEQQKQQWLKPLLNGEIRSCFAMTEPAVASSDATNIRSSIRRQGNEYVINGHKWWTSGAMDPRCKICIFMGKTSADGSAPVHKQQSMILIPMDSPGVKILRPLTVFGYDDAPHGHAEVLFEDVRVPVSNILLGEGRGFEIAQGRLGGGRIHHCIRTLGAAERALQLMIDRVQERVAFGQRLVDQSSIQQDIAKSRIDIELCRLLVLKAAHVIDVIGNKAAAPDVAMIKAAVPVLACKVVDRAIQAHGALGVSQDTALSHLYAGLRTLRIADGPDEVHLRTVAKLEILSRNMAKL